MKYQWILFDADETLFSFHSYLGLKTVLHQYGINFSEEDYQNFQSINQPLWIDYQNKKITAEQLRTLRFAKLAIQTEQSPEKLNVELMEQMALVSKPLHNVEKMLTTLQGKVKMGIITNGFEALQLRRLKNTHTETYFEFVITSEKVGIAKPDPLIFQHAFKQMTPFDKTRILMVGDTLTSDILGANQVGIDSCWYNPHNKVNETHIHPTYEIQDMQELITLVNAV